MLIESSKSFFRGAFLLSVGVLSSCGGGQNTGRAGPPDFRLQSSPGSLTLQPGGGGTVEITLIPLNGFSGAAQVQVPSIPAGVSVSPSQFSVSATAGQSLTISVASTVSAANYTVNFQGAAGSVNHSVTLDLAVTDFQLSLSPSSLNLLAGAWETVQVALTPLNGFSGSVQVQVSNIPTGVTLSQSQFTVSASKAQTITVSTSPGTPLGSYSLSFKGAAGSLNHSTSLNVVVANAGNPPPSRADFVRTDDTPQSAVYDTSHKVVYVSNPNRCTVDVISSTTYQVLKSLPIPSPRGLDISVDGANVYVGTATQALYVIDAGTQKISQRYFTPASPSGGAVYFAPQPEKPAVLTNGSLLLLASTYGTYQITSWNPSTDTYEIRNDAPHNWFDSTGVLARSGDGKKVIFGNDFFPGNVILYDAASDSFVAADVPGYPFSVTANFDGSRFSVAVSVPGAPGSGIYVFDASLNLLTILPAVTPVRYSVDGSKLYAVGVLGNVPVVETFDMQSYGVIGTAPSYATNIPYFGRVPPLIQETPLAADETGRLFGSADHGLAIDDTTDLHAYTGNETFPIDDIIVNPAEGAVSEEQNVQITTASYTSPPAIWFGLTPALNTAVTNPFLTTTAPGLPSTGPVNVRLIDTDGIQNFIPQSYSYGALLTNNPDLAASSAGGGVLSLFGYGLGVLGTQGTTQVAFGSQMVQITAAHPFATEQPDPLSITHLQLQAPAIPPGSYDITVSSTTGTATLQRGYHAVPINSYPLDAQTYSIVYDQRRQQVYLSTANHVDVFSLASTSFLSPITVPTINSLVQLGGMGLSPDGSSLLVTNFADGSVAIVNPDNPASSQVVPIVAPAGSTAWDQGPQSVAVSNTSKALINVAGSAYGFPSLRRKVKSPGKASSSNGSSPPAGFWELDLSTMTATPVTAPLEGGSSIGTLSLKASDDGSKVCFSGEYQPLSFYDSATDTFTQGPGQGGPWECAIGGSGIASNNGEDTLPAVSDLALHVNGAISLTDYDYYSLFTASSYNATGLLVDATGALVYQPFVDEIVIFDGHTGQLRERIAMPSKIEQISNGALARDTTGTQIFAITASGLTVIQLDTLPLGIGSVATAGSTWTIFGTGFTQGTTVSADGTNLNATFANSQTLQVVSAPDLNTVEEITLSNANGYSYTISAAYFR